MQDLHLQPMTFSQARHPTKTREINGTETPHTEYLGLKLDDPSFAAPIYANLFDDEDGEGSSLIWSRPNTRRGD